MSPHRLDVRATPQSMFVPISTLRVEPLEEESEKGRLIQLVRQLSHAVDRLQNEVAELRRRA